METSCWICSCAEMADQKPQLLKQALIAQGVEADFLQPGLDASLGVYLFGDITFDLERRLQIASRAGGLNRVIAIAELRAPGQGERLLEPSSGRRLGHPCLVESSDDRSRDQGAI